MRRYDAGQLALTLFSLAVTSCEGKEKKKKKKEEMEVA